MTEFILIYKSNILTNIEQEQELYRKWPLRDAARTIRNTLEFATLIYLTLKDSLFFLFPFFFFFYLIQQFSHTGTVVTHPASHSDSNLCFFRHYIKFFFHAVILHKGNI